MWHKARAQLSQGVAGGPHHLGWPAMCWRISKNHFVYVSKRGGARRKLGHPAKLRGQPA
jgi:hypothetical protein